MNNHSLPNKFYYLVVVLGITIIVLILVGQPQTKNAEQDLKNKFSAISQSPDVVNYDFVSNVKYGLVSLTWSYKFKQPFSEVYEYYKKELIRNGWKYYEQSSDTDGTLTYYFKQENYFANITRIDKTHLSINLRWVFIGSSM